MTAALTPRNTDKLLASSPLFQNLPVAANVVAQYGWIAMIDQSTGLVSVGSSSPGYIGAGRFEGPIDATGLSNGAVRVDVSYGIFYWQNSGGGDALTQADYGKTCYIADNQTVALTDGTGTRSPAGIVYEVRLDGQVAVRMDPTAYPSNP